MQPRGLPEVIVIVIVIVIVAVDAAFGERAGGQALRARGGTPAAGAGGRTPVACGIEAVDRLRRGS